MKGALAVKSLIVVVLAAFCGAVPTTAPSQEDISKAQVNMHVFCWCRYYRRRGQLDYLTNCFCLLCPGLPVSVFLWCWGQCSKLCNSVSQLTGVFWRHSQKNAGILSPGGDGAAGLKHAGSDVSPPLWCYRRGQIQPLWRNTKMGQTSAHVQVLHWPFIGSCMYIHAQ